METRRDAIGGKLHAVGKQSSVECQLAVLAFLTGPEVEEDRPGPHRSTLRPRVNFAN
jgi:hypothetical protein